MLYIEAEAATPLSQYALRAAWNGPCWIGKLSIPDDGVCILKEPRQSTNLVHV